MKFIVTFIVFSFLISCNESSNNDNLNGASSTTERQMPIKTNDDELFWKLLDNRPQVTINRYGAIIDYKDAIAEGAPWTYDSESTASKDIRKLWYTFDQETGIDIYDLQRLKVLNEWHHFDVFVNGNYPCHIQIYIDGTWQEGSVQFRKATQLYPEGGMFSDLCLDFANSEFNYYTNGEYLEIYDRQRDVKTYYLETYDTNQEQL